ncbi:MAG: hypothetical protein ACI86X_002365 [Moritella sp.]|jgi:hypothetical protein
MYPRRLFGMRYDRIARRTAGGFGLIEVMISIFIFTLCTLSILGLRVTQAKVMDQQQQHSAAWALIGYKLIELRSLTGSSTEYNSVLHNGGGDMAAGIVEYEQYSFNLSWNVLVLPRGQNQLQIKRVDVNVNWNDHDSQPQVLSASTLLGAAFLFHSNGS